MPSYGATADVPELELPESPDTKVLILGRCPSTHAQRCDEREQEGVRFIRAGPSIYKVPSSSISSRPRKNIRRAPLETLRLKSPPPPQERAEAAEQSRAEGPQLQGIRDVSDPEATQGVRARQSG